jgi:hypothetical protein
MTHLNEDTFLLYAAKYYDNPQCIDSEEFYEDIKRFAYLKRLFGKYCEYGELKERLILNHIIILYNIFGNNATEMLFMKLEDFHVQLKPFVVLLGRMPETIKYEDKTLLNTDIPMDLTIIKKLRLV